MGCVGIVGVGGEGHKMVIKTEDERWEREVLQSSRASLAGDLQFKLVLRLAT